MLKHFAALSKMFKRST